jgi:site-specific recombinase XerD
MIILVKQDITGAVSAIMEALKQQGKSPKTLRTYETSFRTYETSFNSFVTYLSENGIEHVDEKCCLKFIHHKTGQSLERFECVTSSHRLDYRMRPLTLLLRFLENGKFQYGPRRTIPAFNCPEQFALEYEAFCEELAYRDYSKSTEETNMQKIQLLLAHLASQGVASADNISIQHIENFLKTLENNAVKYVGVFLYAFRNFFSFLHERGYICNDLVPILPKIRVPRNGSIPYTWTKSDLQKLLGAVDRADPKGKRDYAIFLIAIRLGLRIGDIRGLTLSCIDWDRNTINLIMSKTRQPIELPLLKDIGWAIIDYLQNGRPKTNSNSLFVRHKAPFDAFGGRSAFSKELHRYILKAGLNMPGDRRHGMHSLRNTLAGNMLEVMSPLPVISEALGHQSINTTGIYLKIDVEGLRKCAIDPEGVFA